MKKSTFTALLALLIAGGALLGSCEKEKAAKSATAAATTDANRLPPWPEISSIVNGTTCSNHNPCSFSSIEPTSRNMIRIYHTSYSASRSGENGGYRYRIYERVGTTNNFAKKADFTCSATPITYANPILLNNKDYIVRVTWDAPPTQPAATYDPATIAFLFLPSGDPYPATSLDDGTTKNDYYSFTTGNGAGLPC